MRQVTTAEANEIMARNEQPIYIYDKNGKKIKLYVKADIKMMDLVGIEMYVDDDLTDACKTMIICGNFRQIRNDMSQPKLPYIYNISVYGQTDRHTAIVKVKDMTITTYGNGEMLTKCVDAFNDYFGTSGGDIIIYSEIKGI